MSDHERDPEEDDRAAILARRGQWLSRALTAVGTATVATALSQCIPVACLSAICDEACQQRFDTGTAADAGLDGPADAGSSE